MRKITRDIVAAFNRGEAKKIDNTRTDGYNIWLFGNKIACRVDGVLYVSNAGWQSNTTKERLNGLDGVQITTRRGHWYLNGVMWDGGWVSVTMNNAVAPIVSEVEYDYSCRWTIDHDVPVYSVYGTLSASELTGVLELLKAEGIKCKPFETDTSGMYRPNYFVVVRPDDFERAKELCL